ncbi:hypothetical protein ACHAW6_015020 [Cyclotella cf. meneghiniana]
MTFHSREPPNWTTTQHDNALHRDDRRPHEPIGHQGQDMVHSVVLSQSTGNHEMDQRGWQRSDRAMTNQSQRGNYQYSSNDGIDTHFGQHDDSSSHQSQFYACNNYNTNGTNDCSVEIEHTQRRPPHNSSRNHPDSQFSPQISHDNLHSFNSNFNSQIPLNHDNVNDFTQPPQTPHPTKRAVKRRMRHDLPGPAGVWFRMHNQKKHRKNAEQKNKSPRQRTDENVHNTNDIKHESQPEEALYESIQSFSSTNSSFPTKTRNQLLFHDYSSDLHDCNAWNYMSFSMERIVPSFHAFANHLQARYPSATDHAGNHRHTNNKEDNIHNEANIRSYKRLLRSIVPQHQALIHEIQSGKYDVHHLAPELHADDLRIPLLCGYVSSVSCHAHYDWTAVLVDETYACADNSSGGKEVAVCWLEDTLVKRYPNWIRPGVVWMIEGAKLALFASSSEDENQEEFHLDEASDGPLDISPSTDAARGGHAIDRMILVGESSLVYAWTPEEAGMHFTNEEFVKLMEERCNVGLVEGMELGEDSMMDGSKMIENGGIAECFDLTKDDSPRSNAKSTLDAAEPNDRNLILSKEGNEDCANRCGTAESSGSRKVESPVPSYDDLNRNFHPTGQQTFDGRQHSAILPQGKTHVSNGVIRSRAENTNTQYGGSVSSYVDAFNPEEVNLDLLAVPSLTVHVDSPPSQTAECNHQVAKPRTFMGCNSAHKDYVEQVSSASTSITKRQVENTAGKRSTVKGFAPIVSTTPKQTTRQSSISQDTPQHTVEQATFCENSTRHDPCGAMTHERSPTVNFFENNNWNPPLHSTHEKPCLEPNKCVLFTGKQSNQSPQSPNSKGIDSTIAKNSAEKPSRSGAIEFPLTGDSFDDSLDIDDDKLFYTMNNPFLDVSKQMVGPCLKAVGMVELQNTEESKGHSAAATFPLSTTTAKPIFSSKPYGFDNIDDDMDFLTEDDDI